MIGQKKTQTSSLITGHAAAQVLCLPDQVSAHHLHIWLKRTAASCPVEVDIENLPTKSKITIHINEKCPI